MVDWFDSVEFRIGEVICQICEGAKGEREKCLLVDWFQS